LKVGDQLLTYPSLRTLKVGNSGVINSEVIFVFLQFESLRSLEFSDPSEVDEKIWDKISMNSNLTCLSISEKSTRKVSAISNEHIKPLGFLSQLTNLTLTGCKRVTDISALKYCSKLQYLNLSQTGIEDCTLASLQSLPLINHLLFEETQISDTGIMKLSSLKNLKQLNVNGCHNVTVSSHSINQIISNKGFIYLHDAK